MNLKKELKELRSALRGILDGAKAAGRELTADEITDVEVKSTRIEEIVAELERSEKSAAVLERVSGLLDADTETPHDDGGQKAAKTIGDFAAANLGGSLAKAKGTRFQFATPEYDAKAIGTHVRPAGAMPAATVVDTNVVTAPRRRLVIADLLATETISGAAITYFVEKGIKEGGFAGVGEDGQKPGIEYDEIEAVTEALGKVAGWIRESDEIIEDMPWLVSAINNRLLYDLGLAEENQLLNGDGSGSNLSGLLNRTGVQTETADDVPDNPDAVFRATTKIQTNAGLEADGIVINPKDYERFRLARDENGQYYGGGFFSGAYGNGGVIEQPPLWGLRTVVTPAIAENTVLVGAFAVAGSVIRRGGVRIEATNSNEDDFIHDRVTIRAEERLGLAVRRPAGLVKVTLATPGD